MGLPQDTTPYLNAFRDRPAATEPAWLSAHRDAAMKRFSGLGFPTRKLESWRFTDLRPLTAGPILPAVGGSGVQPSRLASSFFGGHTHRIVLVDGHLSKELSNIGHLPDGVFLASTAEALKSRPELVQAAFDASEETGAQAFASLNAGLFADGFVLALEPGIALETPVEIIHYGASAAAFHVRNVIHAGAGSSATIIDTAASAGGGWTNAVTAIDIGPGAAIRHVKIQNEAKEAIHLSLTRSTVAKAGRYETFVLTMGARLSRQDIHVAAAGEAANVAINGAYLLRGEQEATFAPFVDHQAQGCQTTEVLKGVMQDHAHGVFLGKMTVRPGADFTDAHQLNQNLLLSPKACIDTKPELEIFADEVKCSHGATVGDLDEAALFYLQARGIHEGMARAMLVEAFAASVIEGAGLNQGLTAHLLHHVRGWLANGQEAA
ncbi:MAG: Fe-S cluster assembly protein SufD [Rhodomicrobium sp.]